MILAVDLNSGIVYPEPASQALKNPLTIHYKHHAANFTGRWLGGWARKRFVRRLATGQWQPCRNEATTATLPLDLVTFAGRGSLPEALVMLESFYRYAGTPRTCRIVSDGTLSSDDLKLLTKIHPQIALPTLQQFLTAPIPSSLQKRLSAHPLMMKLALLIESTRLEHGMYIDSDFLFFPAAREFDWSNLLSQRNSFYMQDVAISLDQRLLNDLEIPLQSVNSGLLLFNGPLELESYVDKLDNLEDQTPHHFSEQTIMHLALTKAEAVRLDPEQFILSFDDQFWFRDKYAFHGESICRHYPTPLRHKFWIQTLFR